MATMTIRNLDDALKGRLRVRAAMHGVSMEEEARRILTAALVTGVREESGADLYAAIRNRIEPMGGINLESGPRDPMRDPPDFSE